MVKIKPFFSCIEMSELFIISSLQYFVDSFPLIFCHSVSSYASCLHKLLFIYLAWPSLQEQWGWDAAEPVWRCAQKAPAGDAHTISPLPHCRAGSKGSSWQLGCVWNASHPWSRVCGAQQRSSKGGQSPAGYSGMVSASQCRVWLFNCPSLTNIFQRGDHLSLLHCMKSDGIQNLDIQQVCV